VQAEQVRRCCVEVSIEVATARPLAAVRRSVVPGQVGAVWRPALDLVWAFLQRNPDLRTDGHNVFVYRFPDRPGDPMEADFGVEVTGPFEPEGEVVPAVTPAGRVATALHTDGYATLVEAGAAIEAWCAAHAHALGGASWEIYGDPGPDGQVDVRVCYLLA